MEDFLKIQVNSGYVGCKKSWQDLWRKFIFLEKSELFNDLVETKKQKDLFIKIEDYLKEEFFFPEEVKKYAKSYVDFYESGGLPIISLILNTYCSYGDNIVVSKENSILSPNEFFRFFEQKKEDSHYKTSIHFDGQFSRLIDSIKPNYPFYSSYDVLQENPSQIKMTPELYGLLKKSMVLGISSRVDGELILCNPSIRTLDGEWDTTYLDVGDVSFKSFRSFAECIIFLYIFPMMSFSDEINLDEKYIQGKSSAADDFVLKIIDLNKT